MSLLYKGLQAFPIQEYFNHAYRYLSNCNSSAKPGRQQNPLQKIQYRFKGPNPELLIQDLLQRNPKQQYFTKRDYRNANPLLQVQLLLEPFNFCCTIKKTG